MKLLRNGTAILDEPDQLSRWVTESSLETCDSNTLGHLLPLIKPGDVVVDGGAALGDHTSAYLKAVGPTGIVYAFEPHPLFFECLKHNCPIAHAMNVALMAEPADEILHECIGNFGASTLAPTYSVSIYPVTSITLDSLKLERLNFMKLDLEGAEYFALQGAEATIKRCRPILCIEVNQACLDAFRIKANVVYNLLDELGYAWERIMGDDDSARCTNCEIVCKPKP